MKNKTILITGAKGFIGKNLVNRLCENSSITILEYNRNHNLSDLKNMIESVDFIFHFAGEVRPKSSDTEFFESNALLTQSIIKVIQEQDLKIPIFMTSSIHAKLQKNAYGKTKREAELLLENYSKQSKVSTWIYRLPHVFGEGCKANYNSVISTWIQNTIDNKEIIIYDRNIPMTYVYVQDVINECIHYLNHSENKESTFHYIEPKITYSTTLGEVADNLEIFREISKVNIDNFTDFQKKFYITYLDYIKTTKGTNV